VKLDQFSYKRLYRRQ